MFFSSSCLCFALDLLFFGVPFPSCVLNAFSNMKRGCKGKNFYVLLGGNITLLYEKIANFIEEPFRVYTTYQTVPIVPLQNTGGRLHQNRRQQRKKKNHSKKKHGKSGLFAFFAFVSVVIGVLKIVFLFDADINIMLSCTWAGAMVATMTNFEPMLKESACLLVPQFLSSLAPVVCAIIHHDQCNIWHVVSLCYGSS